MKFVDFVAKIKDDPDMVLDLAQMAWAALAQFFAPADPPEFIFSNWEEATWPIK